MCERERIEKSDGRDRQREKGDEERREKSEIVERDRDLRRQIYMR